MGEQVIGHYVPAEQGSSGWQAALAQSTDLFRALVSDDLTTFEKHLASLGPSAHSSWHTVLFWSAPPHAAEENEAAGKVEAVARSRTLAMLATQHGSMRVLSYLLSSGADPTTKAKDGADCYTVSGAGVAPADPAAGESLPRSSSPRLHDEGGRRDPHSPDSALGQSTLVPGSWTFYTSPAPNCDTAALLRCWPSQVMDDAHPNAATIRGMLNDAAGNWPASTSSQQHPSSAQHSAPGTAAAGASGARIGNQQQVRAGCLVQFRWSPTFPSPWCTDLGPVRRGHRQPSCSLPHPCSLQSKLPVPAGSHAAGRQQQRGPPGGAGRAV